MLIALIIALTILVILLTFSVKNMLTKVETYEDKIVEYEKTILTFQKYYAELTQAIRFSDEKLKIVDHHGTFKSDDEVGYFYQFLEELQTLMNSFDYSNPKLKEKEEIK